MGAVIVSSWYIGAIKSYMYISPYSTECDYSWISLFIAPLLSTLFFMSMQCICDVKRGEGVSKVNVIMTLIFQK